MQLVPAHHFTSTYVFFSEKDFFNPLAITASTGQSKNFKIWQNVFTIYVHTKVVEEETFFSTALNMLLLFFSQLPFCREL